MGVTGHIHPGDHPRAHFLQHPEGIFEVVKREAGAHDRKARVSKGQPPDVTLVPGDTIQLFEGV